jgi:hypothetical protein
MSKVPAPRKSVVVQEGEGMGAKKVKIEAEESE